MSHTTTRRGFCAALALAVLLPVITSARAAKQSERSKVAAGSPAARSRPQVPPQPGEKRLIARTYNSGFERAHDTFNGMGVAGDGKIYYVLTSTAYDVGAKMFCYDPAADKITPCGDLTEACGEKDLKAIVQGKSHVTFVESGSKLYFASHLGYYSTLGGKEKAGTPPEGFKPYPGGHFLAYDMKSRTFEDLAKAPRGEGIISMAMDTRRGRLYGLTWPTGNFIRYDLAAKEFKNLGPTSQLGESGDGKQFRVICRSLVVNPGDGSCYFTVSDGDIFRYRYDRDAIEKVEGDDMRKDYFGLYDPTVPGHMGYNWRQAFWYEPEKAVYGIQGNSGYLFRFIPGGPGAAGGPRVEVLERLTSLPSKRKGMNDRFNYGYLGFALGPDGRTIHYLTGSPVHFVTYDIPTGKYGDQGAIFFENGDRPAGVQSLAIGKDGTIYSLARIREAGKTRTDLFSVKGPFESK